MKKGLLAIAILLTVAAIASTSCNPYTKLAKSKNLDDKDSAASYFYRKGKCEQAVYLLEELMALRKGSARAQEIYYMYANCRYKLGELVSAAFYFEEFTRQYPGSPHVEEFAYKHAYCHYLLSDPWSLDQSFTYKAIEKLQIFVSRYPYSTYKAECEKYLTELWDKLAKKSWEQASLYYKIGYYRAAVQAYQNNIREFPDSKYREESQFMLFKSAALLADKSIESRKKERYEDALDFHKKFADKYSGSKFAKDAESIRNSVDKELNKVNKKQQSVSESQVFSAFTSHLEAAIKTTDPEIRKAEYSEAVETLESLRKSNPGSPYLKEAEKWFSKWEKATGQKQN